MVKLQPHWIRRVVDGAGSRIYIQDNKKHMPLILRRRSELMFTAASSALADMLSGTAPKIRRQLTPYRILYSVRSLCLPLEMRDGQRERDSGDQWRQYTPAYHRPNSLFGFGTVSRVHTRTRETCSSPDYTNARTLSIQYIMKIILH
jgi:hypothetical protein